MPDLDRDQLLKDLVLKTRKGRSASKEVGPGEIDVILGIDKLSEVQRLFLGAYLVWMSASLDGVTGRSDLLAAVFSIRSLLFFFVLLVIPTAFVYAGIRHFLF